MEQPAPADGAGMNDRVAVGEEAGADIAVPGVARRVQRHINEHRRTENIIARDTAPIAGVERIFAIVAHDEVAVLGDRKRQSSEGGDERRAGGRLAPADGVIFDEFFAVDPDGAVTNVDSFTREADDALDVIGLRRIEGRLEDDDLLALGFGPQGNVDIGEWNSGVVADAAHDEVVANQQRVFHRAGRNNAGLAEGAVDEHEGEDDPEPGDDFAFDLGAHGGVGFFGGAVLGLYFDCVSFHDSPCRAIQRYLYSSS